MNKSCQLYNNSKEKRGETLMITKELVEQINRLAKKQKTIGLTEEEKLEQKLARNQYLEGIRTQMKSLLDSIKFTDSNEQKNGSTCTCGQCSSKKH